MMDFAAIATAVSSYNVFLGIISVLIVLILGALNIRNRYSSTQDAQTIRSLKDAVDGFAIESKLNKITLVNRDKEIALLSQKADILEKHVTQAPQINELAVQLAVQHKELMEAFSKQSSGIGQLAKELGNVAKAVVKGNEDAN